MGLLAVDLAHFAHFGLCAFSVHKSWPSTVGHVLDIAAAAAAAAAAAPSVEEGRKKGKILPSSSSFCYEKFRPNRVTQPPDFLHAVLAGRHHPMFFFFSKSCVHKIDRAAMSSAERKHIFVFRPQQI